MKRFGLALVLLTVAAFFAPLLLRGDVIFPHDNGAQVGSRSARASDESDTNESSPTFKFNDQSSFYVPELHAALHAPRSGWIATWTNAVELGRPLTHLSGLSPAYAPTWVLSRFVDDAFVLYTWLVVLTVAATAAFAYAFFRAIGLDVWACFAGACSAALGVPVIYWLTFPMNVSGFCWTFCLLWLVTRVIERPNAWRWVGVAAAVQLLLLSGYAQQIVWHGAFVAAWTIARVLTRDGAWTSRLRMLAGLGLAAAVGVACAAPVYADVLLAASRSSRDGLTPDYFVASLPEIHGARDVLMQVTALVVPRLLGDPFSTEFPLRFQGVAFGSLVALLVAVSWGGGGWRRLRTAYAFLALGLALTFVPSFYRFGVEHLGLGFSRTIPSWGAIVPALIAACVTCDRIVRHGVTNPWRISVTAGTAVVVLIAAVELGTPLGAQWRGVVTLLLGFAGLVVLVHARKGAFAALLALGATWNASTGLVLGRPRAEIQTSSPLVEEIRARTRDGSRYAVVGFDPRFVLPPNQELLLGLSSVFSYDSLASRGYLEWVARVSTRGPTVAGRRFHRIADASRVGSGELEDARVSLLLAARPIAAPNCAPSGTIAGFHAYQLTPAPPARVVRARVEDGAATVARGTDELARATVELDEGDHVRLRLEPRSEDALVWLARQYHPQWTAHGADTVVVNGVYQGVRVPAGVDVVDLEFRPWSRWAWLPELLLATAFLALAVAKLVATRRSRAGLANPGSPA